jgi:hypothetical protein
MVTYVLNMYGISVKYPLINSLFGSGKKSLNQKIITVFLSIPQTQINP